MILDTLRNAARYADMHPGFDKAFAFLRREDVGELPEGRQEIDGDNVYALVVSAQGKGRDAAKLETHRKYIDIQFALTGTDEMGWQDAADCAATSEGYDAGKDLELYSAKANVWCAMPPGTFGVFFPEDAHAPLGGMEGLRKIVVKILV